MQVTSLAAAYSFLGALRLDVPSFPLTTSISTFVGVSTSLPLWTDRAVKLYFKQGYTEPTERPSRQILLLKEVHAPPTSPPCQRGR